MFVRKSPLITIIISNLFPIFGYLYWGLTPFFIFWLFWVEGLIISFFNVFRILIYKTEDESLGQKTNIIVNRLRKSLVYIAMRIGVFVFYSIFVITFIGFVLAEKNHQIKNASILAFRDIHFNTALLYFVGNQLAILLAHFITFKNHVFKPIYPTSYILDRNQLIIHVAVVLAGVSGQFLKEHNVSRIDIYLFVIVIFCIVKTLFDFARFRRSLNDTQYYM